MIIILRKGDHSNYLFLQYNYRVEQLFTLTLLHHPSVRGPLCFSSP